MIDLFMIEQQDSATECVWEGMRRHKNIQSAHRQRGEVKISPRRSVFCDLIVHSCDEFQSVWEKLNGGQGWWENNSYLQTTGLWWEAVKYSLEPWMEQREGECEEGETGPDTSVTEAQGQNQRHSISAAISLQTNLTCYTWPFRTLKSTYRSPELENITQRYISELKIHRKQLISSWWAVHRLHESCFCSVKWFKIANFFNSNPFVFHLGGN